VVGGQVVGVPVKGFDITLRRSGGSLASVGGVLVFRRAGVVGGFGEGWGISNTQTVSGEEQEEEAAEAARRSV